MRILAASFVVGHLFLISALAAAAGPSTFVLGSGGSMRLTAVGDATTDRDSYTQKARDEMQEWQRKLHEFGEKSEAKGKEVGDAAEDNLHKAWTKAEAASRKLQAAGAEGWKSAQTSYEKASQELKDAWRKVHPENK